MGGGTIETDQIIRPDWNVVVRLSEINRERLTVCILISPVRIIELVEPWPGGQTGSTQYSVQI